MANPTVEEILLGELANSFFKQYFGKGDAIRINSVDMPHPVIEGATEEVVVMFFKGENPCENARRFFKYMEANDK